RVTVTVKQYNSRSFFIQGAVQGAGVYQVEGHPSLLELVTLAGGLSQNHGSTAFVIRKIKPSAPAKATLKEGAQEAVVAGGGNGQTGEQTKDQVKDPSKDQATAAGEGGARADAGETLAQYTLLKVNINGLLKGRFEQNMFLEPGDIVNIPPTE